MAHENTVNFGIFLQTLCFLGMLFDMCPWSCDLSLCGALFIPGERRCWRPFTADTRSSNNVTRLHKPPYWLQASMWICFSSSGGRRPNFGWAAPNIAVGLEEGFLWQQVRELHISTQAVPAREAGHRVYSFTQFVTGTFVTTRPDNVELQHQNGTV